MPTNIAMPVITKNEKVTKHIKFAADKTGVDFDYLLQTAKRESALNINAKAKTSSATGLFQFIRQTWYETLHDFGPKHGYAELSSQIKRDSSGRYFVPNQKAKSAILNLRKDPKAASLMAAEFSKQNINYLKGKIGRQPVASELYMAPFM
ncbi:MAG: transglycosylase SLT domain-containing protein, partial [Rhizobiales bacterium]|nr:transglycosylase SLT domain-containing protein [Hyphomicrobiales bacterium]